MSVEHASHRTAPHRARRRTRICLLLVVAAVTSLVAAAGGPAWAAPAPAPQVTVVTSCFTAAGPDGRTYRIQGRRYTVGSPTRRTPAIVLVHGVDSNAETWDLTPKWSVARRLAQAGYVVIAYDRLGYRYSRYGGADGPQALTTAAQQSVLHDLVTELHAGSYRNGAADGRCAPNEPTSHTSYRSDAVAVIGHSAGGFVVSSYPARYHDVVAMVQANSPSGLTSTNPPGNAALLSATAPPPHGAQDDLYGPVGDPAGDTAPRAVRAGYSYSPGPARTDCEEFTLWRPGALAVVATPMCNPANSTATPLGESQSFLAQAMQADTVIPQTGDIPVLLADTDHDGVMPGQANALEYSAWRDHCGCDVTQFVLRNTGHAFMAHRSVTTWVGNVVAWLGSRGVRGTPAS